MTDSKMQWFGVALQDDGQVIVTKARGTEEGAVKLAEQRDGVEYFAVEAANAGEAKKKAAERALKDTASAVGGLGEPSADDIAKAVDAKAESAVAKGMKSIGGTRWYGATLTGGGDAKDQARVTEVGHRTIDEAIAEGKSLKFVAPFGVQAVDAEAALLVVDALGGKHDGEPIFAKPSGTTRAPRTPADPTKGLTTARERGKQTFFPVGIHPETGETRVDPGVGFLHEKVAQKRLEKLEAEGWFKAGSARLVPAWDMTDATEGFGAGRKVEAESTELVDA